MGVKKKTLSFPEEVWTMIEENARLAGTTPSAYVSDLVLKHRRLEDGRAAMAEWKAENRDFTAEEIAWADRLLDAASAPDADGVIDVGPRPDSLRHDEE